MQYYYLKNRLRYGPVKFEELKSKDIKKILVWYEGLKDWTKAGEIKELKELFKVKPPPIPPPPIPPPPPAPKKEFKTPTPPPLPKKKVIIEKVKEEIKEPSISPPSIVKKEKNLSPPAIKTSPIKKTNQTETQKKDNEIGPPPIKKNKKPLGIKIIFWVGIIGSIPTFAKMLSTDFIDFLINLYGDTFATWTYVVTLFNIIGLTQAFFMYRLGPIIYISIFIIDTIYCLNVGIDLNDLIISITTKTIFSIVMITFYKKMKKRVFNKLVKKEIRILLLLFFVSNFSFSQEIISEKEIAEMAAKIDKESAGLSLIDGVVMKM